jgi:hypothetical protein
MTRPRRAKPRIPEAFPDPYRELWLSLTPGKRLRRLWRMRSRIKNLQAVHDEKSLPKL